MTEKPEKSYLFGSMEEFYTKGREKFEKTRAILKNRELNARIRKIIHDAVINSSDNIKSQPGTIVEGNTVTLTAADIIFGDMINPGEAAVTKSTNWFPYGQREINGKQVDFSIAFASTDFVKISNQGSDLRPGFVTIKGKLTDSDGFTVSDHPLARLQEARDEEKMLLLYEFRSEITYGTEDYNEIVKMVASAEEQQKQNPQK